MTIGNVGTNSRTQVIARKLINRLDPANAGSDIPTDKWFGVVASSIGLKDNKQTLTSDSFNSSLALSNMKGGNIAVEGPLNMNLLKEGQEWIYNLIFGGAWTHSAIDTATNKYTHTLIPDPDVRQGVMLLERQIRDMTTKGYKVFCNSYVDSVSISVPQDGICKVDATIFSEFSVPATDATRAVGVVPFVEDDFFVGNRGQVRIQNRDADDVLTGVERTPDFIRGATLDINTNLVKDAYTMTEDRNQSVYVSQVGFGQRSVSGTLDVFFTADSDFEAAVRDLSSVQVTLDIEEDGYITRFILPKIKLPENYDPDVAQGDGFVTISVPFTAVVFNDTGAGKEYEMKIEIVDSLNDFGATWEEIAFV